MLVPFHIIIPARYASTRLHGKLLMDIAGKTVLERVYNQAMAAHPTSITIAVDDNLLMQHVATFGGPACLTSKEHSSGTDRLAEVVRTGSYNAEDIIVNVQGDEPLIDPRLIQQVVTLLATHPNVNVATLYSHIENANAWHDQNVVKVVFTKNQQALYFSRSPIPFWREPREYTDYQPWQHAFRHIGIYAYRAHFLLKFTATPPCTYESQEMLEQLRILWMGESIQLAQACAPTMQDINTLEDLIKIRTLITQPRTH